MLTKNTFTLPTIEFQEILLAWLQFIAQFKVRKVEVTQGAGIIDIISDGFINAMVIEKPVAAHWPDCGGSVGEYYSVSKHSYNRQKELTADMNNALISGSDLEVFEVITNFLNLFTNNIYDITISEMDIEFSEIGSDYSITYAETISHDDRFTYWHYPNGLDLYLFTRSHHTIDQARVTEYVDMISSGKRPKLVVHSLSDNYELDETSYYILDGHHKLCAYQQLRINPPVVFISRAVDIRPIYKNILTQLLDVLNDCEIMHVLDHNNNTTDITVFMELAMVHYLDKLLKEKKSLGTKISAMLYNAYHCKDEGITEWAKQRFSVLSTNNYQGKGQSLPYKLNNKNLNYETWAQIFIENLSDFCVWKKVLLGDGEMPDEILEKQKMLWERYHPRPEPQPPASFPNIPYESPTRTYPDSEVFRMIVWILLAAAALLSLMKGCR